MSLFQCSAYDEGHVSGPLCSDLCKQNSIHLGKCLTTVPDKKIYDGTWHGKSVILKVNMSWLDEFQERKKITDNDVASSYQNDVLSRVDSLFGNCSQCTKLVSRLLLLGDGNSDGSVTAVEARTFISLLQHMEPMMLMTLNESKHTVDFYGYCGGLYMVEKVPFVASDLFGDSWELIELPFLPDTLEKPIKSMFNYYGGKVLRSAAFFLSYTSTIVNDTLFSKYSIFSTFQTYFSSKREKFDFAYLILDATADVSVTPYGLTQSCDLHLGNYGITNTSAVKLIDLDLLYPHVFLRTLLKKKKCVSDLDCFVGRFDYCWSDCDKMSGTCKSLLGLQDIHMICEGLFPIIFSNPSILHTEVYNHTCLEKAIKKLGVFCSKLPVVYSVNELKQNLLTVKKRLKSIELKYSENC